jgi:hypothetical protein
MPHLHYVVNCKQLIKDLVVVIGGKVFGLAVWQVFIILQNTKQNIV